MVGPRGLFASAIGLIGLGLLGAVHADQPSRNVPGPESLAGVEATAAELERPQPSSAMLALLSGAAPAETVSVAALGDFTRERALPGRAEPVSRSSSPRVAQAPAQARKPRTAEQPARIAAIADGLGSPADTPAQSVLPADVVRPVVTGSLRILHEEGFLR